MCLISISAAGKHTKGHLLRCAGLFYTVRNRLVAVVAILATVTVFTVVIAAVAVLTTVLFVTLIVLVIRVGGITIATMLVVMVTVAAFFAIVGILVFRIAFVALFVVVLVLFSVRNSGCNNTQSSDQKNSFFHHDKTLYAEREKNLSRLSA